MAYTNNKIGNVISFVISLVLHLGAVYLAYFVATSKDETLFSEKDEAPKMMSISLNQISPSLNDENSMQATQDVAPQAVTPPPEPEPVPEPPKEKPKEEPKPEPPKPEAPKVKPKPKPEPKKIERVVEELSPQPPKEQVEEPKPAAPQTPVTPPSSQSVANNEAVSQGGAPQSGQSKSDEQALARTVLGQIHAAILKHKTYPKRAVNSKMEGRTQVGFLLTAQCEFQNLEVLKSGGHSFLDKHALDTIKKACKDFPKEAIGMNLKVVISFNLKEVE